MKKYILLTIGILLLQCKTVKETNEVNQNNIDDKLLTWQQVGPSVPFEDRLNKYNPSTETYWFGEGRISSIWIDPKNDDHLLVGVGFGGLFETIDAGENWKCLTDKIPVFDIHTIEVKDDVIYISTGYRYKNPIRFSTVRREFYGLGVIKSTDWGKTWQLPKTNFYAADFSLSKNHETIYAIDINKVFKSNDNGLSFHLVKDFTVKHISNKNHKVELYNVAVHPNNPKVVYVSASLASSKGGKMFYKSEDGGLTWSDEVPALERFIKDKPEKSVGHYIKDVALHVNAETEKLWVHYSVAFEFENSHKKKYKKVHAYVLKSSDFKNFNLVTHQEIFGGTHYSPKIYEKDETIYLEAWYLQMKRPEDKRFTNMGARKVHQDCRAIAVDSKGVIYYGHDAGFDKSTDNGNSWTNAFKQLNANLIREMGYYSDGVERRLDIGTHDAGYYRSHLDGRPRYPIEKHEGGIYTSPHNKDRIYIKDRRTTQSIDGGKTFQKLVLNDGKQAQVYHSDGMLLEDPVDENVLYLGHVNDVYVSDELGKKGSWQKISPKNGDFGRSIDMAIPKSNNKRLYLANRLVKFPVKDGGYDTFITEGHLMRSDNRGKTWTKISTQFTDLLSNAVISDVEVDDENPDHVWFSVRNLEDGNKVFYSDNAGKTWTNISYNLPNVPANRIEYNQKSKRLILANDYGVYYLNGTTWKEYGNGLPKTIITSMVLDHYFNEIIVSTFGRGVWRTKLK